MTGAKFFPFRRREKRFSFYTSVKRFTFLKKRNAIILIQDRGKPLFFIPTQGSERVSFSSESKTKIVSLRRAKGWSCSLFCTIFLLPGMERAFFHSKKERDNFLLSKVWKFSHSEKREDSFLLLAQGKGTSFLSLGIEPSRSNLGKRGGLFLFHPWERHYFFIP